jgi:5-hydroxyisourate hydrolase
MKKIIVTMLLLFIASMGFSQQKEYQLSTHILDVSEGLPARDVKIKLEKLDSKKNIWHFVSEKRTNKDGRIGDFLSSENKNDGIYRFTFYTEDYFKSKKIETFYPFIEVVFKLEGKNHFHVPITLSAFGYSTYRGS